METNLYRNQFINPQVLPIQSTAKQRIGFMDFKKKQSADLQNKIQREIRDDEIRNQVQRQVELQDRLQNVPIDLNLDQNDLMNTQQHFEPFDRSKMTVKPLELSIQNDSNPDTVNIPRPQILHIDSRDRDINKYPFPNHYVINPGVSFQNIKSIELISTEFPNSAQVITNTPPSSANNNVYWINEEDAAIGFPIYQAVLDPGNYISSSLESELQNKMNLVPRRSDGGLHEFTVSINVDTDIVTFLQDKTTLLPIDPISTTVDTNIITVNQPGHGFSTGDEILIKGSNAVDGITSTNINGTFIIVVIDANTYEYAVAVTATSTANGGGANVRAGKTNPFKMLWSNLDTPGHILGFPQEDSSEPIAHEIQNIIIGATVNNAGTIVSANHGLIEGMIISIIETNVIPSINGIHRVTKIVDANQFEISCSENKYNSMVFYQKLSDFGYWIYFPATSNFGQIKQIAVSPDGKITTYFPHNLVVGEQIELKNTVTIPDINGPQQVSAIISPTTFAIGKPVINFDRKPSGLLIDTEEPIFGTYGSNRLTFVFHNHTLVTGDYILLYDCGPVGGIPASSINVNYGNKRQNEVELSEYTTRKQVIVLNPNVFQIMTDRYATSLETGGGYDTCITADTNPKSVCINPEISMTQTINFLGFRSIQQNTQCNGNLNRVVQLEGEPYVFMTSPVLDNIKNSGKVGNIFAKILLSDPPGTTMFNTFVSVKKEFDYNALPNLGALEFTFFDYYGNLYDFNKANHSFTLLVYEYGDRLKYSNESSYRGRFDNSGALHSNVSMRSGGGGGGGGGGNQRPQTINTSNERIRRSNNTTGKF